MDKNEKTGGDMDKDELMIKLLEIPFLRDACRKTYKEYYAVDGSIGGAVVDSLLIEGARLVVDKLARAFESLDSRGWDLVSEGLAGARGAHEILLELLELGPEWKLTREEKGRKEGIVMNGILDDKQIRIDIEKVKMDDASDRLHVEASRGRVPGIEIWNRACRRVREEGTKVYKAFTELHELALKHVLAGKLPEWVCDTPEDSLEEFVIMHVEDLEYSAEGSE